MAGYRQLVLCLIKIMHQKRETTTKALVQVTSSKINVDKWIKLLNKSHIASHCQQQSMGEGGGSRKKGGSLRLTGAKRRMMGEGGAGEKQVGSGG